MEIREQQVIHLPTRIFNWFRDRGVTEGTLEAAQIGWDGKRIVIPIYGPDGGFLFNKYRRDPALDSGESSLPKYQYDKGGSAQLYGLPFITRNKQVIICEGEFDVLLMLSKGFSAISSTGGSGSFNYSWVNDLLLKDIYICYDNDEAGIKGAFKVQQKLPWARIVFLPKEVGEKGDVTDYFRDHDTNDFKELMESSFTYKMPEPVTGETKKAMNEGIRELKNYVNDIIMPEERKLRAEYKDDRHLQIYKEFYLDMIEDCQKVVRAGAVLLHAGASTDLKKAKLQPIDRFVKFNQAGFARCIWHEERSPSMHWYRNTNKVKCFGCDKMGDVIDVVQRIKKVNLSEAIKIINK